MVKQAALDGGGPMSAIHRTSVGTYHPEEDKAAPWSSVAQCTVCGWHGPKHSDPHNADAHMLALVDADGHKEATGHDDVITCTTRPTVAPAWTIHDSRGYIDGGSPCDECGRCECAPCPCGGKVCDNNDCQHGQHDNSCTGLSFSFVCLDGGNNLCRECADKAGVSIVECDCA